MWLGDDDWLDPNYVSLALVRLETDTKSRWSAVRPIYYEKGIHQEVGRVFSLLERVRGDACWRTTGK